MSEDIICTHCGKKSSLQQWLITTAYALAVSIEQFASINNPIQLYFCPCCGLPNTRVKQHSQDNQNEEKTNSIAPMTEDVSEGNSE